MASHPSSPLTLPIPPIPSGMPSDSSRSSFHTPRRHQDTGSIHTRNRDRPVKDEASDGDESSDADLWRGVQDISFEDFDEPEELTLVKDCHSKQETPSPSLTKSGVLFPVVYPIPVTVSPIPHCQVSATRTISTHTSSSTSGGVGSVAVGSGWSPGASTVSSEFTETLQTLLNGRYFHFGTELRLYIMHARLPVEFWNTIYSCVSYGGYDPHLWEDMLRGAGMLDDGQRSCLLQVMMQDETALRQYTEVWRSKRGSFNDTPIRRNA